MLSNFIEKQNAIKNDIIGIIDLFIKINKSILNFYEKKDKKYCSFIREDSMSILKHVNHIDNDITTIIARFAPEAKDLLWLMRYMKIIFQIKCSVDIIMDSMPEFANSNFNSKNFMKVMPHVLRYQKYLLSLLNNVNKLLKQNKVKINTKSSDSKIESLDKTYLKLLEKFEKINLQKTTAINILMFSKNIANLQIISKRVQYIVDLIRD